MHLRSISFFSYKTPFLGRADRKGIWIQMVDELGKQGWGEVAPLPGWSLETLSSVIEQLEQIKQELIKRWWTKENCLAQILELKLFPSVAFGLESALLSLLDPLVDSALLSSALIMGSFEEMREQIKEREKEGFKVLKLKIGALSLEEAETLLSGLIGRFQLRVDVNRKWETETSLSFFSQFDQDSFEYVEEPFADPKDLIKFPLPLAVDESFPQDLSFEQLEKLSMLKALIYKPTLQGGMAHYLPVYEWASSSGVDVVVGSSFESRIGLAAAADLARRLRVQRAVGLGTYFFMQQVPSIEMVLKSF